MNFTGKVYLLHAKRRTWVDAVKGQVPETLSVADDGIVVTGNPMPYRYADAYFDVHADGTVVALEETPAGSIEHTTANQQDHRRIIFNPASELVNNPQCVLNVETFYVGSPAALLSFEEDDRVGSLSTVTPGSMLGDAALVRQIAECVSQPNDEPAGGELLLRL